MALPELELQRHIACRHASWWAIGSNQREKQLVQFDPSTG